MPSADERHSRLPPSLPLQRSHLRATPDERRSADASREPSWSSGAGADSEHDASSAVHSDHRARGARGEGAGIAERPDGVVPLWLDLLTCPPPPAEAIGTMRPW